MSSCFEYLKYTPKIKNHIIATFIYKNAIRKKIAVADASGFIGRVLCDQFQFEGFYHSWIGVIPSQEPIPEL